MIPVEPPKCTFLGTNIIAPLPADVPESENSIPVCSILKRNKRSFVIHRTTPREVCASLNISSGGRFAGAHTCVRKTHHPS